MGANFPKAAPVKYAAVWRCSQEVTWASRPQHKLGHDGPLDHCKPDVAWSGRCACIYGHGTSLQPSHELIRGNMIDFGYSFPVESAPTKVSPCTDRWCCNRNAATWMSTKGPCRLRVGLCVFFGRCPIPSLMKPLLSHPVQLSQTCIICFVKCCCQF